MLLEHFYCDQMNQSNRKQTVGSMRNATEELRNFEPAAVFYGTDKFCYFMITTKSLLITGNNRKWICISCNLFAALDNRGFSSCHIRQTIIILIDFCVNLDSNIKNTSKR